MAGMSINASALNQVPLHGKRASRLRCSGVEGVCVSQRLSLPDSLTA